MGFKTHRFSCGFFLLLLLVLVFFFNVPAGELKAVAETSSGNAGLHPCHRWLPSAPSKTRLHRPPGPDAGLGGTILLMLGRSEGEWEAKPES